MTAKYWSPNPVKVLTLPEPTKAEIQSWRKDFDQFAVKLENAKGQLAKDTVLTERGFIESVSEAKDVTNLGKEIYGILFEVADQNWKGFVTWEDYVRIGRILKRPDADFVVAFYFFVGKKPGPYVSFEKFKEVMSKAMQSSPIPFNFDTDWVHLYLGGGHELGYREFTQLIKNLQFERLRQSFRFYDKEKRGYITADQFQEIVSDLLKHKVNRKVIDALPMLCTEFNDELLITYSEVQAFHTVVRNMDTIEYVVRIVCDRSPDGKVSLDDFRNTCQRLMRYNTLSPMESAMAFALADGGRKLKRLSESDFQVLLDPMWDREMTESSPNSEKKAKSKASVQEWMTSVGRSIHYFILGGIAGTIGATSVYPIDLIKTRLQSQRKTSAVLYNGAWDCIKKVYKNEGILGFYKGLVPQLLGVAPEKAIKLAVNDMVRRIWTGRNATNDAPIPLFGEILAGAAAGGCQVVFTNPLEIVKIRLQMQGEILRTDPNHVRQGTIGIARSLGIRGLYKGAAACLCRDVPFSAIYFPAYNHLKKDLFHEGMEGKVLSNWEALAAASIAGAPAAYLTTPADVVKTRLQAESRPGDIPYKGVRDAFSRIYHEEGLSALFRGGLARVIRSSPQFGVTLLVYENLKVHVPYTSQRVYEDESIVRVRTRNALKVLLDVHPHIDNARNSYEEERLLK